MYTKIISKAKLNKFKMEQQFRIVILIMQRIMFKRDRWSIILNFIILLVKRLTYFINSS